MWVYEQRGGRMMFAGAQIGVGYSGAGEGKNNPAMQSVHQVGPIPCGEYTILSPRDTDKHGPFVLPLVPRDDNEMFGRDGFLIHGDSIPHPGTASQGCIILARDVREAIWHSGDRLLQVVSGDDETVPDLTGEISM